MLIFFSVTLILLISSFICISLGLFPRVFGKNDGSKSKGGDSIIYYGDIVNKTKEEFSTIFKNVHKDAYLDDILSNLLNEPIPGNGVFRSSANGRAYPLPIRILSFQDIYSPLDPEYNREFEETYASTMSKKFKDDLRKMASDPQGEVSGETDEESDEENEPEEIDVLKVYVREAVRIMKLDDGFMKRIQENGVPWRNVTKKIEQAISIGVRDPEERNQQAHQLVTTVMLALSGGEQGEKWNTEKRESKSKPGTMTSWVKILAEI